jgi:hypothetical protein
MPRWIYASLFCVAITCGCGNGVPFQQPFSKGDLLSAAGFHWKLADSADWKISLASLPANRFATQVVDGRTLYFYADANVCRCIYYGTEQNWAAYKQLLAEQKIITQQEISAYVDQAAMKGSGG